MGFRPVTIRLDEDLEKKLRLLQADLVLSEQKYWSFSKIVNFVLSEGYENAKMSLEKHHKIK